MVTASSTSAAPLAGAVAMVAAARKYERVVQVGTQRRSTPHLFEARDLIQEGRLGRIGLVETYCYGRRGISNPPDVPPPENPKTKSKNPGPAIPTGYGWIITDGRAVPEKKGK